MTDGLRVPRLPLHVGVLVGLSASSYALLVAGTAGLQATADARLTAERAPIKAEIEHLVVSHDALLGAVNAAGQAYEDAARSYEVAGLDVSAFETRLADLAARVAEIEGAAAALPANAPMPQVSRSVGTVSTPTVQATTGASGG